MNLWTEHGTKVLGAVIIALPTLEATMSSELQTVFSVKGYAAFRILSQLVLGALVIYRGFGNTKSAEPQQGVPP